MPNSDTDSAFEAFRYDLVQYLAVRFDVLPEVALGALGDWLVNFEPQLAPTGRTPRSARPK